METSVTCQHCGAKIEQLVEKDWQVTAHGHKVGEWIHKSEYGRYFYCDFGYGFTSSQLLQLEGKVATPVLFKKEKLPDDGDTKIDENGKELLYDNYWGTWQSTGKLFKKVYDSYSITWEWVEIKEQAEQVEEDKKTEEPKYKLDNTKEVLEKKKAKSGNQNLTIVDEQPNQLMLDYDYEEVPPIFKQMLPILDQRAGPVTWKATRSSSGNHWHVVVDMANNMEPVERVAWQAVFGSDHIRESLSLLRLYKGASHPIVLFMDPTQKPELEGNTIIAGRKFREE